MDVGSRIAATIILGVSWIVILVVHLFFFADGFSIYQNIAIEIVNLAVMGGLIAVIWVVGWERK